MEVKVGIRHMNREVTVETDETAVELERRLTEALSTGGIFRLNDEKNRTVLIPAPQISYVDLGQEHVRKVGFGAL